ncbi:MAG: 2-oxo acid dehydrogenase subunit E2 [Saprospiraceae bacterium]|jgi:2-oxoglutarate dehydrogenase E2 component (dihydrolipoamide succinyltransferase)|uniref:dihydrolipoamide acetyltransferase family protein n=1 Tax=Candidatus Brachybacter algidus TaxID=2982024 RepID=UPI001EC948B2|nr:dihydrolipoamide acetyltransferase family protein [Candidatus Brachybacter algidus]MBK7604897.1 2-oxo acid dehydrogenase subunit E2 [Candidatus Brachybacter algidus]MBK8844693.1 2-oxo acid dehydrogenase subunit E2 [Candidatus Brachybacter algidus]MBK9551099.1 2-oxo acid dehydrogenase subunit E2 [Candidatus Brachybacter algidus]MBL0117428.1 2-oxo acid dehydrogenase subunit E2 [Candidatus Brachybacter algidus]
MATYELIMPKMGESIMEATILNWVKNVGDTIEIDETIIEIATDKVDSEIPSPVAGTLSKILFNVNDVVPIGTVIALIDTGGPGSVVEPTITEIKTAEAPIQASQQATEIKVEPISEKTESDRFYSPLVKNIAKEEGISVSEMDKIPGSGQEGRLTKNDLLAYLKTRSQPQQESARPASIPAQPVQSQIKSAPATSMSGDVEIIEMDRMRKLIADHMVMSKHVSPHVTSFVEVDMTNIVRWREKVKKDFNSKYGQNITFTPIFIDAVVKAIRDYPMINCSVDGTTIMRKKNINIGMAAALPSGNLIVPVIKDADNMNLIGLTKTVNDLAGRAKTNQLKPEEIQGGTFTITNVGSFGNIMGTPIINQPQVAIMAIGAIKKKPAVLETADGDVIAIRHMMFLSLSYDHRVVDGMLGGSFLRRTADYLEAFDINQSI